LSLLPLFSRTEIRRPRGAGCPAVPPSAPQVLPRWEARRTAALCVHGMDGERERLRSEDTRRRWVSHLVSLLPYLNRPGTAANQVDATAPVARPQYRWRRGGRAAARASWSAIFAKENEREKKESERSVPAFHQLRPLSLPPPPPPWRPLTRAPR